MPADRRNRVRSKESRSDEALAGGRRFDRCRVISASGYGAQAVWVLENGEIAVNSATTL